MSLEYVGFKPLRAGRIHLFCPHCGRKMSNVERDQYDPPTAVLAHVPCERCSQGCKVEGASYYLDAAGKGVSGFVECPECGTDVPWYEFNGDRCPDCHQGDRE